MPYEGVPPPHADAQAEVPLIRIHKGLCMVHAVLGMPLYELCYRKVVSSHLVRSSTLLLPIGVLSSTETTQKTRYKLSVELIFVGNR